MGLRELQELSERKESVPERWRFLVRVAGFRGLLGLIQTDGALQCVSDTWADVCGADVAFQFGLLHELSWLFASATEQ